MKLRRPRPLLLKQKACPNLASTGTWMTRETPLRPLPPAHQARNPLLPARDGPPRPTTRPLWLRRRRPTPNHHLPHPHQVRRPLLHPTRTALTRYTLRRLPPSSSSTSAVSPATASATNSAIPRSSIFPSRVWTSPSTHPSMATRRWQRCTIWWRMWCTTRCRGLCARMRAGSVRFIQMMQPGEVVRDSGSARRRGEPADDLFGESYLQIWQKRSA